MINLGDRAVGATLSFDFNTHKADGTPITLAGTPAVLVYKDSTTESASTGITLTTDYDSRTGMHHVVIDTSANSSFFATGNDFSVVITAGTVDSISVVGTVVAKFSLDRANVANIKSTAQTARDIGASVLLSSGTGAGQLDFTSGIVKSDVTKWLTGTPNALQSGRVDSYIGAILDGVITAAKFAANALDAVWSTTVRVLTAATNIAGMTVNATKIDGSTAAATNVKNAFTGAGTAVDIAIRSLQILNDQASVNGGLALDIHSTADSGNAHAIKIWSLKGKGLYLLSEKECLDLWSSTMDAIKIKTEGASKSVINLESLTGDALKLTAGLHGIEIVPTKDGILINGGTFAAPGVAVHIIGNADGINGNAIVVTGPTLLTNPSGDGVIIQSSGSNGNGLTLSKNGTGKDLNADETDNILARLGAITGTGVNTVLGFFKALLNKSATAPTDIGGTFSPASDSTEAISEDLTAGVDDILLAIDGVTSSAISKQDVRDAMALNTLETPASSSIDKYLTSLNTNLKYPDGAVYAKYNGPASGTTYPAGIATNPVVSLEDAKDIAETNNIPKIIYNPGADVTFGSIGGKEIVGVGKAVKTNKISLTSSFINGVMENLRVSLNAGSSIAVFRNCNILGTSAIELGDVTLEDCFIEKSNTVKMIGGKLTSKNCQFDDVTLNAQYLNPGSYEIHLHGCRGKITVTNLTSSGLKIYGFDGTIVFAASCTHVELVEITGLSGHVENNGTGSPVYADDHATDDVDAILKNGMRNGTVKYVDKDGADTNGGHNFGSGNSYLTIAYALTQMPGGGILYVGGGQYQEDFVIPDNVSLIGIFNDESGAVAEIRGSVASTAPTITMGKNTTINKIRVGKQDGTYSNCCVLMDDNASIVDCSFGGFDIPIDFIIDMNGAMECEICKNWIYGSDEARNAIGGSMDNSEILDNTFSAILQDHIVILGNVNDIERNSFIDVQTGYYAVKSGSDSLNVTNNNYNGAGEFHSSGTGTNHIVQNNEQWATDDILTTSHGAGAWNAGSSIVTVGAFTADAETQINSIEDTIDIVNGKVDTIDTVVDGINVIVTASSAIIVLLQKYERNRKRFVLEGVEWFLVIYDNDNTTVIVKQKVEKYGGGAIANLSGSETPSWREKTSV